MQPMGLKDCSQGVGWDGDGVARVQVVQEAREPPRALQWPSRQHPHALGTTSITQEPASRTQESTSRTRAASNDHTS